MSTCWDVYETRVGVAMRRVSGWTVAVLVLSVPLALVRTPAWAGTQAAPGTQAGADTPAWAGTQAGPSTQARAGTHGWASTTWTDLWQTQDQQAQHLMQTGKAAEAATRFKDERQQAYAELEAGQYANAAQHLAPFKDADSQYNRGNALAHSGDLRGALSAYDQALASKPDDKDVQHNRDLVARALQQQRRNGKDGSQGKDGNQGKDSNQDKGGSSQGKQSGQDQAGQGGQQQSGNESEHQSNAQNQQSSAQQSSAQNQQSARPQSSAQNQQSARPQSSAQTQQNAGPQSSAQTQQMNTGQQNAQDQYGGNQAQQKSPQQAQTQPGTDRGNLDSKHGDKQDTERQAQEAAKEDVAQANATNSAAKPRGDDLQLARQMEARQDAEKRPPPPTEQSLTLEQWLRRIPDDPGELLRRKFLVEHMQKQGGSQ